MNAAAVTLPKDERHDTLAGLVERLEARDALALPDRTVPLTKMRMTAANTITIPGAYGSYAMSEWARGQLARQVGLNWEKWTANARATDVAEELNRRFSRATEVIKVRSTSRVPEGIEATGMITALLSPDYTPVADGVIGAVLRDVLASVEPDTKIVRYNVTDLTTNVVVRIGEKLTPSAEVGALEACIYVRNSGVGFAKLVVGLLLHRLACSNGLIVSLPGSTLVRAVHRGIDIDRIRERLAGGLKGLPERINTSAKLLAASTRVEVGNVELEVRDILREARLPLRLVSSVMSAYLREPARTRFGVVQALTLAAQNESPEVRYSLERAAGMYVAQA
jgi:hypothetical protein